MRLRSALLILAGSLVVAALGFTAGRYAAFLLYSIAIAGIGAMALNVIVGYGGQISFVQGALLGVGAYTAGNLGNAGVDGGLALLSAAVVTALVSALTGLPALRLRGLYFGITTLAAQFILEYLFKTLDPLTQGVSGLIIRPLTLLGHRLASEQSAAAVSVLLLGLVWIVLEALMRSNLGRALRVVRESEIVARGMGIDVPRTKFAAFLITGAVAGLAGGLLGFTSRLASPEAFDLALSTDYLAMIILGGLGSLGGSVVGAVFVALLPEAIQRLGEAARLADFVAAFREMAFGILVILFLVLEPRGLAALLTRLRRRVLHVPRMSPSAATRTTKEETP